MRTLEPRRYVRPLVFSEENDVVANQLVQRFERVIVSEQEIAVQRQHTELGS